MGNYGFCGGCGLRRGVFSRRKGVWEVLKYPGGYFYRDVDWLIFLVYAVREGAIPACCGLVYCCSVGGGIERQVLLFCVEVRTIFGLLVVASRWCWTVTSSSGSAAAAVYCRQQYWHSVQIRKRNTYFLLRIHQSHTISQFTEAAISETIFLSICPSDDPYSEAHNLFICFPNDP